MAVRKMSPTPRSLVLFVLVCLGGLVVGNADADNSGGNNQAGHDPSGGSAAGESTAARNTETALRELEHRYGEFGCVITNPRTGQILFVYNNELVTGRSLCPGSLLKPFGLLALARAEKIDPTIAIDCKGRTRGEISCWLHEGHGRINLTQALAYSCNFYFYYFFKGRLQKSDYAGALRDFGLPALPGIERMSMEDFYKAAVGLDSNYMVTPLQIITAYNALFNGGVLRSASGETTGRVYVPENVRDILFRGMRECALYGTGKKIFKDRPGLDVIIKTGTGASVSLGTEVWYKKARWVVILSPGIDPVFSMLVVMEKKQAEDIHDLTRELLKVLKVM
jgi:cell division protein FtsI/penicillin-binding protein 2